MTRLSILALLLCCLCGVAQARPGMICGPNGCRPARAAAPVIQRPQVARRSAACTCDPCRCVDCRCGSRQQSRQGVANRPFARLRARFQAMRARRCG